MTRRTAPSVCATPGCAELAPCPTHKARQVPGSERRRARGIRGSGWDERVRNRRVLRRDGHTCQRCGAPAEQVDHVIPRHRGGPDTDANKQALCGPCHADKTAAERSTR